ncbi:hypothetical protein RIF29_15705 [Crotalaria pallida]|uniref:Ubiquitin-like protease family profile domain-containing protein n=1 Tax=Crotalaria pallida TaxID=3830 RepID=A0AAN9FFG3_CROPI
MDKTMSLVENENAILKDKLRSYEQIEGRHFFIHTSGKTNLTYGSTKESGPSLPSGSAWPPIILSNDDDIEKIIDKCKDPITKGSKFGPTSKKHKNVPFNDTVVFSKHADEVPMSTIEEYRTPPATKRVFGFGRTSSGRKAFEETSAGLGEILFKCAGMKITCTQVQSLIPGNEIPHEADVLEGKLGNCAIVKKYLKAWMPHSEYLEYIFLPVYDESDSHWWLAVISFVDETVYYLDTYQAYGKCNHRKTGIWILANCISTILPSGSGSKRIGDTKPDIRDWPISTGSGVPECGNNMHSALYVQDWISMQQCFQPNVFGLLDENVARMSVAMKLLLSSVNEVGAELKLLANEAVMT